MLTSIWQLKEGMLIVNCEKTGLASQPKLKPKLVELWFGKKANISF